MSRGALPAARISLHGVKKRRRGRGERPRPVGHPGLDGFVVVLNEVGRSAVHSGHVADVELRTVGLESQLGVGGEAQQEGEAAPRALRDGIAARSGNRVPRSVRSRALVYPLEAANAAGDQQRDRCVPKLYGAAQVKQQTYESGRRVESDVDQSDFLKSSVLSERVRLWHRGVRATIRIVEEVGRDHGDHPQCHHGLDRGEHMRNDHTRDLGRASRDLLQRLTQGGGNVEPKRRGDLLSEPLDECPHEFIYLDRCEDPGLRTLLVDGSDSPAVGGSADPQQARLLGRHRVKLEVSAIGNWSLHPPSESDGELGHRETHLVVDGFTVGLQADVGLEIGNDISGIAQTRGVRSEPGEGQRHHPAFTGKELITRPSLVTMTRRTVSPRVPTV